MYCVLSITDSINSQISSQIVKSIYECTMIRVWVKIEDAGNRRYRTGGTMSITMYRLCGHFKLLPSASIFNIPPFSTIYALKDKWSSLHQNPGFRVHMKIQMDVSPLPDGIISFEPFLSWFGPLLSVAHPRLAPQRKHPVPTPWTFSYCSSMFSLHIFSYEIACLTPSFLVDIFLQQFHKLTDFSNVPHHPVS